MDSSKKICRRIRQILNQAGINQQEFAQMAGISQPAVSQYLNGRVPPAAILLQLARIGKTSVEWILTGYSLPLNQRIGEPAPAYGKEQPLLNSWRQLPVSVQKDLLTLIHRLAVSFKSNE